MNTIIKTGITITALALTITACKKDPVIVDPTGTVMLHVHHKVGPQNFAFDTDYLDDSGNTYQWTRAHFYLRVAGFTDHDGDAISGAPTGYYLMDPSDAMINLGTMKKPTTLHNIIWGVGVDSTTNHSDPTTYASGNDLSPQNPSQHWSWSSGYIFAALEGRVDKNANGTYESNETFVLHIGTDAMYRDGMSLHVDTSIPEGGTGTLHLDIDYAKFITGVNLSTESSTHTMNNMPLATKVANNFQNVLKLH